MLRERRISQTPKAERQGLNRFIGFLMNRIYLLFAFQFGSGTRQRGNMCPNS